MSIPGVVANLTAFIGTDTTYIDTVYQANGSTPQDLTGASLIFQVFAYGDRTTVFITKTTPTQIILYAPAQGIIQWTVSRADTINMRPNEYEYIVERVDPGNDAVVSRGLFTVLLSSP